MTKPDRRYALITGANKGLGRETARQLGRMGMTVLIGARDAARGENAAHELRHCGIDARFVHLDVTDEATVRAVAAAVEEDFGRLDVLVNNAGIVEDDIEPSATTAALARDVYATNVFGVITTTHALLPLLRTSPAGRVVNLSSRLGSLAKAADLSSPHRQLLAYNSSKAALNSLTLHYAREFAGTALKINSATPGYVATDLNGHQGTRTVEEGARIVVHLATLGEDGPTGGFFDEEGPVAW
ncbi:SDR family oxidoreductase [Streptomyces lavendulae]|uniref:SDR family oxidoreductase n=1 Tax=Streptomyces lavendulae TaxID=1914 RepID=UPI0024A389F7|nr:SDR family oxidoreductase [Streptomyces lavendulae]GLW03593.1 dehydrogenase [Streptomyces lavendulae subsp. lavendulae]